MSVTTSGTFIISPTPAYRCAHAGYLLRTDLLPRASAILMHDCGKTTRRANHQKSVQPFAKKYSAFVLTQISRITPLVSRRMRALANVTNARGDAMDGRAATDVCGSNVRRSRVVRAPRCWR